MKLKANLHLHTDDDPKDVISYSLYDAIDEAKRLEFDVVALTCHGFFAWRQGYEEYAKQKNILLIPGIELALNGPSQLFGRHVVVLNCSKDIEKVRTLDDLRAYKHNNPQIFVLAPHPYYPHPLEKLSLFEYLKKYIDLFDAIELSWFYSKWFKKRNRMAEHMARKHGLPFLATSDTHFLEHLELNYAVIDAKEKNVGTVLQAIIDGDFYNVTAPRKFWSEMVSDYVIKKVIIGDILKRGLRK